LLSPETHEKRRLTSPPKGVKVDTNPAFSPDGRTLAFVRYGFGGTSEIYLQRVSGEVVPEGEPRQLTSMNQDTCYPAWMPDGKEIVFASGSKSHSCRLWRIPISGSIPPKPLPFSSEVNGLNPVISLEKHRLVYSVFSVDANIWRCEIPKGGAEPAPQQRFLPSSRVQEGPQYSPDGKSIAYLAWTSGSGEIWVCDSDGANPMQLTQLGGPVPQHPNWSPDGQKIIFALASRGQTDLYVIPVQGGEMRQLTHTTFNELGPSFSRDGKWIYFGSDHNGDFQIWKMPAEGGEALLVARRGGSTPQESPDGKVLFYLKSGPDEDWPDELWKVPVEGGEETQVLDEVWYRDFVVKQDGIYFRRLEQDSTCFLFYDFAQGKTKPIAKIRKGEGFGLTVSPDEQWILFAQVGDLRNYLMLVENFR
jgi:Tol biopolymer transport system component